MGFLKKFFGKASAQPAQKVYANPWEWLEQFEYGEGVEVEQDATIILLTRMVPQRAEVEQALGRLPALLPAVQAEINADWGGGESYGATLTLTFGVGSAWGSGTHLIILNGEAGALSAEIAQRSIHLSNWSEEMVTALYDHQARAYLTYGGEAPKSTQLALLYAVATTFAPVGVADLTAHNAIPGELLPQFFTAESLQECRSVIPTMLWTGIIKYQLPDQSVYYVTRGFERFGVANLAHHAPFGSGEKVMNLFDTLLNYQLSSGSLLAPGHTSENSTQRMSFREPLPEFAEALSGGLPVLDVLVQPK